ncbi:succinate dehydrogenase, cytochrome b556 subunit [Terrihabitans sp. B22-R8]|uniref:succinate dehydrogenase, cytochrome b556 subunit n=1 Tax=Terrihabitans sp. B22-R8 TaxID=3425128 RepID=UPI00403C0BD8
MADTRPARSLPQRPISPHLDIYRFTWTMAMSIAHRITGMIAYLGIILLVVWLGALAQGREAYERVAGLYGSWIGIVVLIGLSWAIIHHAIGGVRHIVWDTGRGVDRPTRMLWAQATLVLSVALTILLWLVIYLRG